MRYFLEFAYNGTRFWGYQAQKNGSTVQQTVEKALSKLLRCATPIMGCGRTDSGVHALQYFAHFDSATLLDQQFIYRLNNVIGPDITFQNLYPVHPTAHARFDAISRSYSYHIDFNRNPFRQETSYFCSYAARLDIQKMQTAAKLLLDYQDFKSFCKSKTDVKTTLCELRASSWHFDEKEATLTYQVTANRFLRGMIRLIVGMSLNVGKNKLSLDELTEALEKRQILPHALSAPAKGLFLRDILYEYL